MLIRIIVLCLLFLSHFNTWATELKGNLNVDNTFEAYLSTDDSVQGVLLASGNNWPTTETFNTTLQPGVDYYLHIRATDVGGVAGFLGEFDLTGSEHTFANGLNTLSTNPTDWQVSTSGWNNYVGASSYGQNGVSPWGNRPLVNGSAQWIWSSDNNSDNLNFFTTKITATQLCQSGGTFNAVALQIGPGGSDTQVNTTTEAQSIYQAWLAAGSPETGLIDNNTYNIVQSGLSTADRIDFGGNERTFSGTLPYPGFGVVGNQSQSQFLVHATATIELSAGDYTMYVESDDGFSLELNTIEGDNVTFNKFGGSSAGQSNELRFELPTANANTGGSFTLTQDTTFEIETIFFERSGGDFLEVSISSGIRTSRPPTDYEILSDGALSGSVKVLECPLPPLIAEFRFEESLWDGSPNEVIDSSGNNYHGSVVRNSLQETQTPALMGNPGTCAYVSQSAGSIQVPGLPLDTTTTGVKTTVTFWMNWDGTDNVMPIGWNIHDIWMFDGQIGFNSGSGDLYGIPSTGLANTWHHIAVEFTNGDVASNKMFINGVEQSLSQLRATPNNARAFVDSQMRIGGWSINSGYDFYGLIDEVRIYEGELNASQVRSIMRERRPCIEVPVVHHYEIRHDGQGLTCESESITVLACSNDDCSNVSEQQVTLDILINGAVNNTATFTGSTNVDITYTVPETVSLSVANETVLASEPFVCDDGTSNSCSMVFTDAGFRFLYSSANLSNIPTQIAGDVFSDSLQLQAVENNNGVCVGLFNGNQSVRLSQENVNPGGTGGLNFSVNGSNIAKYPAGTATTLNFSANSIATIALPRYEDAGQIRLRAEYDDGSISVTGASQPFWVRPAQLHLEASATGNALNGADATSLRVYAAGEAFDLSVTALNSAGVTTPNYTPGQLQFAVQRTAPTSAGSVDGQLHYAPSASMSASLSGLFQDVSLSPFSSGVSAYGGAFYSEVGLISLDAQDRSYGNGSIIVPASAINIGRFTPHHFTQTVADQGVLTAQCGTQSQFTVYTGQTLESNTSIGAISYLTAPTLAITAFNKQGQITQNYHEDVPNSANDFMRLSNTNISITPPTQDSATSGIDGTRLPVSAIINTGTVSQNDLTALPNIVALPRGVVHYQLSNSDHFLYQRSANAKVAPFTSSLNFAVASITDADNVSAISTVNAMPTGVSVRFGRLVLENSFGPETSNIPQLMRLEHFNGNRFITSLDNSCTSYDASDISLSNISLDPSFTSVLGSSGNFVSGQSGDIFYQAPGSGNQGEMQATYDSYDWLKYDWNNDGVFDDNPSAIVTFGAYRGDDRFLHWREQF
jgi:hypothetical protein